MKHKFTLCISLMCIAGLLSSVLLSGCGKSGSGGNSKLQAQKEKEAKSREEAAKAEAEARDKAVKEAEEAAKTINRTIKVTCTFSSKVVNSCKC